MKKAKEPYEQWRCKVCHSTRWIFYADGSKLHCQYCGRTFKPQRLRQHMNKATPSAFDSLDQWHRVSSARTGWIILDRGILQRGRIVPVVTHPSNPAAGFADVVWNRYGEEIETAAMVFDLDPAILVATICAESGGDNNATRAEYHLGDASFGLCQLLTSTAYEVGRAIGWPIGREDFVWWMPAKPKVDLTSWQAFLSLPWCNIHLCAAYYDIQARLNPKWKKDPIMLYASYNAGGCYESDENEWGLHSTPQAINAFRNFFNDHRRNLAL